MIYEVAVAIRRMQRDEKIHTAMTVDCDVHQGNGTAAIFENVRHTMASVRDLTASLTITLAEAAKGAKKRVQLPTGKEVEVKIPAGIDEGQQMRLKGQGLAGPGGPA